MKLIKIAGITAVVVLVLAVLGVGLAFAQRPAQALWDSFSPGGIMGNGWNGYGMMGGTGMMGGYNPNGNGNGRMGAMHQWMAGTGGMHTLVWDSLAEALGLTPDELNAELSKGKTPAQIAEERGVSQEELSATLETAVKAGLEKAVAEGVLTQEQADAMLDHMAGNYAWMLTQKGSHMGPGSGYGPGGCHGSGNLQDNT